VLLFESDKWDESRLASPYDTDLFAPIIRRVEELSGKRYGEDENTDRAIRIVAEHSRAVTFLVGDERTPVLPSNEERGYVVRRMLRRAVYFGRRHLGIDEPFMAALTDAVVDTMAPAYPELDRQRAFVKEILEPEERRFDETLSRGLEMLEDVLEKGGAGAVSGADAFLLHDTYGFPVELTREIATEHGLRVDEAGFEAEMERQRERARASAGGVGAVAADALYASLGVEASRFLGYETLEAPGKIGALLSAHPTSASGRAGRGDGAQANDSEALEPSDAAAEGQGVELVMEQTPFYPEGGGQVGDRGEIVGPSGRVVVEDTQRVAERLIVHRGRVVEGRIAVGDEVTARVDGRHREDTMRNHTATHLLHAALRKVLGTHVKQAGSLVAPDHLRFDFTHIEAVTRGQLAEVERLVNEKVRQNVPVHTRLTSFDEAMSEGVLAFFGEKYGEEVRVVEVNTVVPRFSAELCGGTHCERTGDVGLVIITGESSIGAGMRRIEALSGRGAEQHVRTLAAELEDASRKIGGGRGDLIARIDALIAERDGLQKRVERMERSLASAPAGDQIAGTAIDVDGVKVLASQVDLPSVDALRYRADALRKTMPSGVAVLGTVIDGRPQFVAIVSPDVIPKGPKAGEILKRVAAVAGGGGGGRPEMAQGGGKDASKIKEALAIVPEAVREMLSGDGASAEG
jgi:alanyl-tRNA synthetase